MELRERKIFNRTERVIEHSSQKFRSKRLNEKAAAQQKQTRAGDVLNPETMSAKSMIGKKRGRGKESKENAAAAPAVSLVIELQKIDQLVLKDCPSDDFETVLKFCYT